MIDRAHGQTTSNYCDLLLQILQTFFQFDKLILITCKRNVIYKLWTGDEVFDDSYSKDLSKEMRKMSLKTILGKTCELTESMHEFELLSELVGRNKAVYCYRCNDTKSMSQTSLYYFFAFDMLDPFQLLIKEYTFITQTKTIIQQRDNPIAVFGRQHALLQQNHQEDVGPRSHKIMRGPHRSNRLSS